MRRFSLVVALGAVLAASAGPALAQVPVTAAQAEAASSRNAATGAATRRITEILTGITGDPGIGSAPDAQGLAAAIERRADGLRAELEELRALHRDLTALPPIQGAAQSPVLQTIDKAVDDVATLSLRAATLVENLLAIPDAVRSGDDAAFQRAYRALIGSTLLFSESRAAALRNQAQSDGLSPVQRAEALAMACFADGEGALQSGILDLVDRSTAAANVAAAEACMRDQVSKGRAHLAADGAPDSALRREIDALDAGLLDGITDAADLLADGNTALKRGENSAVIAARINPRYQDILQRLQTLTRQQQQALDAYNRRF